MKLFCVFKLKTIFTFIIVLILLLSSVAIFIFDRGVVGHSNWINYCVVLDAGHGGRDGGCVGVSTGVKESDLALSITKKLENYLTSYGINVVLTRKDNNGLYGLGKNKKLQDMEARKKIINQSDCDCVVSVHLNSFSSSSAKGAQSFHQNSNETGKLFADTIQNQLSYHIDGAKNSSGSGDYYILQCEDVPSTLIECGYLSNKEEEALLITNAYQEKIAYAIFCGIIKFFNCTYS